MDGRQSRFLIVLAVFFLWVTALFLLAIVSSREPPQRPVQKAQP